MHIETTSIFNDLLKFRDKYKGQYIVLKYGGALAADKRIVKNIGRQAAFLNRAIGAKVIIVHGGGEQATAAIEKAGIKPNFHPVTQKRITDEVTLDIFDKTVRKLNKDNVTIMRSVSDEVVFQGMAGYDLDTVIASPENNFTGKIDQVNTDYLTHIGDHIIPVFYTACRNLSPVNGESRLNVNADDFAAAVGVSVNAMRLVLLSDIDGVMDQEGKRLTGLSTDDIDELIENGTVTGGMVPKLENARKCAQQLTSGGVVILNGATDNIVLQEILYEKGAGTLIRSPKRIASAIKLENK